MAKAFMGSGFCEDTTIKPLKIILLNVKETDTL